MLNSSIEGKNSSIPLCIFKWFIRCDYWPFLHWENKYRDFKCARRSSWCNKKVSTLTGSCIIYYNIPIFWQFELVEGKAEKSMLEEASARSTR